ncbi:hypothetical protein [Aurantiacibacter suaedae]|uniref:hypothetical protein n=1 Tax=Aurantiacibacter suaedae TaxID=2545755 RepID=UPI0010FA11D0|nr:hypothetical protein [Aurantiacibacter suaedae]
MLTFLSWQLVEYRGLVARLIEWQFARFDASWPIVTLTVITLLLTSPITLTLLYRLRKARSNPKLKTYEAALHRSRMMRGFLAWIAGGLALCAAGVASLSLTIVGIREKPLPITLADLRTDEKIEGRVVMDGTLQYGRIGFFEDRLLFSGKTLWVAPVLDPVSDDAITLFVEIGERKAGPPERRRFEGVLRHDAARGELRTLYRNAGYRVHQPTYVLFADLASARSPYLRAGIDLLVAALIFLIFCGLQHRRTIALQKRHDAEQASES